MARDDEVDDLTGECRASGVKLFATFGREARIAAADQALAGVAVGLAVTDEHETAQGAVHDAVLPGGRRMREAPRGVNA